MTSCYGAYQFFDYDLFKVRQLRPDKKDMEYPKDSLMGVIVENFPEFAQIVIKSKFDRRFADPQGKYTVFISDFWDRFSAAELDEWDVNDCKNVVASNTIEGRIRYMDLMTSQSSQLNSVDNTGYILVWVDRQHQNRVMKGNEWLGKQIDAFNGIIHTTHSVALPCPNIPVSPEY